VSRNQRFLDFLTLEVGTDRLYRNVGKKNCRYPLPNNLFCGGSLKSPLVITWYSFILLHNVQGCVVPYILNSLFLSLSALKLETLTYPNHFYLKADILLCESPKLIFINSVNLSNSLLILTGGLVEISEGKRQFAKSRHRFEDNINMDLQEIEWHNVEWIYLSQNRPSGGLSFHIISSRHIMCIVQFELRVASLNKLRDKDFYSFGNTQQSSTLHRYALYAMGHGTRSRERVSRCVQVA